MILRGMRAAAYRVDVVMRPPQARVSNVSISKAAERWPDLEIADGRFTGSVIFKVAQSSSRPLPFIPPASGKI